MVAAVRGSAGRKGGVIWYLWRCFYSLSWYYWIVYARTNNKAPCKGFSYVLILPLYITAFVRPCVAYYKGFYCVPSGIICKLQGISIKIFFDFEIDFDRDTISKINVFFSFRVADLPEPGRGIYEPEPGRGECRKFRQK